MSLKRIVEDTDTFAGRLFDAVIVCLILVTIGAFSVETLPDLSPETRELLRRLEVFSVAVFTVEYLLRFLVADRKLAFVFSFFGIIDLLAILPFYVALGVDLRSIRALRLLRLARILKLARYGDAMARFRRAAGLVREELVAFLGTAMVLIYLSAVGIYYFENTAQPERFASVFDSLWWAVVTLTTVGYGDAFPVTAGGRTFTFLVLMAGLGVVAVPTGLIASALARVREEEQAEKRALAAEEKVVAVTETALYVADLDRSLEFYQRVLGFTRAMEPIERMVALDVTDEQVLLLFKQGASVEPTVTPYGTIPPSDSRGQQHVAFGIRPVDLERWRGRLEDAGVEIESVVDWPEGGHSLYFRDPDHHAIELKTSTWRGRPLDVGAP